MFYRLKNMTARDGVCFSYMEKKCYKSLSQNTTWSICFRNIIKVSNNLDPDQAQDFVGPYLGPNILQILLKEKTLANIMSKISGLFGKKVCTYDTWCSSTMIVQAM